MRQDQGATSTSRLSDLLQRDQEEQEAAGAATPDWLRNAGAVLAGGEEDPAEVTMDQTTFVGGGMIPEERPADGDDTEMEFTRNHSGGGAAGAGGGAALAAVVGRLGGGASRLAERDERRWQTTSSSKMTAPPAAGAQQPPRRRAPAPAPRPPTPTLTPGAPISRPQTRRGGTRCPTTRCLSSNG